MSETARTASIMCRCLTGLRSAAAASGIANMSRGRMKKMIDLDREYEALQDAIDRGEISEQEAADEWRWAKEEFFREANERDW